MLQTQPGEELGPGPMLVGGELLRQFHPRRAVVLGERFGTLAEPRLQHVGVPGAPQEASEPTELFDQLACPGILQQWREGPQV